MSIFRDFGSSARAQQAPATVGVTAVLVAGFLAMWIFPAWGLFELLAFDSATALSNPWTFLTYPYATVPGGLIGLVFLCMWLWGIGGSVERELGPRAYLRVWFAFSALCAFGLWLGALALSQRAGLWSAWTPVAALTVIWGTRNASAQIMLMFVLPISGRWLAWLSAGLVFFGTSPAPLAPFAAAPLLLAYLYAANRLTFAPYGGAPRSSVRGEKGSKRRVYSQAYYDEVKRREQAREEKERLRRLFEKSMIEDPDDPNPK